VLTFTTTPHGNAVVCALEGELDSFTAASLHGILARVGATERLVVDMSGVKFVDSAGISALVAGARNQRGLGSDVVLAVPAAHMRRLFRTVGLDRIVALVDGLVIGAAS
jgi:anti-sigma B factor antagonist